MMAFCLFSQGFSIMMAQFRSFFGAEIGFLRCMKMFFHLFYDMFCFKIMFNFQVSRRFDNLVGVSADRAELPFLETIHVRKSPAGRAPYNEVHDKEVMRVILIKIYRLIAINYGSGKFGSVEFLFR